MMNIKTKKRKHDDTYSKSVNDSEASDHGGNIMIDECENNFEVDLFEEMGRVNSQLISIGGKIKLVDNLYFVKNGGMIDEFIGNMNQFLKDLESHRRKAGHDQLNSDILSHVYQFLDTNALKDCCGLVCKLWRESMLGLKVKSGNKMFLNSSLVRHVSEFKLIDSSVEIFESLSTCTSLNQLKSLDLSQNKLDTKQVELLTKCHMPCLTELKLKEANINETDTTRLLNSELLSNIKKLDLPNTTKYFTNNFYELVSESKHLNQLTHLEIINEEQEVGKRIDLLLKDKVNLEHLHIENFQISTYSKILTNGTFMNLTFLDISFCHISNQEFANLLVSPGLPKLLTLKADYLIDQDKTIAIFPSNSQSSITELDFYPFRPELIPSLFDHCTKLKNLKILPDLTTESTKDIFSNMMKSPNLANLEVLTIAMHVFNHQKHLPHILEDIFVNPVFSNLTELYVDDCFIFKNVKFLSTCTNLVNLTRLDLGMSEVASEDLKEECSTLLKTNPTFSKLKYLSLPMYFGED